ncbi:hypothetical protein Glove_457g72 [Diversispora epigaea]|uniref:NADH dehydrogenase [ubiquinone] 1 alpha subcomplex subunit 4 n=1 Tax=Diversispora epigaea TaxID=1348612 RepID=A0A397GRA1_9GLOM|nr:hypothetical protein Glove_457g72 [Diversispora epigaea]
MVVTFLRQNQTIIPLVAICAGGVGAGLLYAMYTLKTSPEVAINKVGNPHPWNSIQQHQNAKLITINKDFFENRRGLESPSRRF